MATATFTGAEADAAQQFEDTPGEETEDSQDWQITVKMPHKEKVKQVQVSPKVRQGTNPSRLKEEPKHILKKPLQQHNPPTHNQVPARIPLIPQQRFPLRTPSRPPPKTRRRKPHPILLRMSKVTSRQGKFG